MDFTMVTAAEPDPTEPVRMRSGERKADTLLRVLRLRNILFIATSDHFRRFSDIINDDMLALEVLQLASDLRQTEPNHPGFKEPEDEPGVEKAFGTLRRVIGFDIFQLNREGISFDELVTSTLVIARDRPDLLHAWLFILLSGNTSVEDSITGVTFPSFDVLDKLAKVSRATETIVAQYRGKEDAGPAAGRDTNT